MAKTKRGGRAKKSRPPALQPIFSDDPKLKHKLANHAYELVLSVMQQQSDREPQK